MAYTALTDPFTVRFDKDGVDYEAMVTYAKMDDCSEYFFHVDVQKPEGIGPIHLKEKPTLNPEYEYMVWVDDNNRVNILYQQLGSEIERQLKTMGVFLIDSPVSNHSHEDDESSSGND